MIGSLLVIRNKPLFTADWQAWVFLGVVVTGVVAIMVVLWNTRRK